MALIAFLFGSFVGLMVAVATMTLLGFGIVAAFGIYMAVGLLLPFAFVYYRVQAEHARFQAKVAPSKIALHYTR